MATSGTQYDPSVLRGKDGFFTSLYRFFDGLGKNKGALAAGVGTLVLVGVIGSVIVGKNEAKSEAGKGALYAAQKAYETEMKALAGVKAPAPEAPKAPVDAAKDPKAAKAQEAAEKARRDEDTASMKKLEELQYQKLDVDAKFPQTVQGYKSVIEKYSGTRAAYEARMALGSLYFDHGEAVKAAPVLKEAVDSAPGGLEKALSYSALGYAYENSGKPQDAAATYEKALNLGEAGIKGDLLLALARSQEAMKDTAKARSIYDRIITELPNTEVAKTAETLKAQLQ